MQFEERLFGNHMHAYMHTKTKITNDLLLDFDMLVIVQPAVSHTEKLESMHLSSQPTFMQ